MKPNPPGSSPEACKAAGQGERSCPVCQACGEVSGPRSGLGSESGPVPKPGAIPGPGLGPKAIPEPQELSLYLSQELGQYLGQELDWYLGQDLGLYLGQDLGLYLVEELEATASPTPAPQQKTQAKPTKAARQKVLVTGGGGYLGFSLGSHLAKSGTSVILLDRRRPQWELSPETEFIQADVRDEEALYRAFEGVDCVFHVASYGMSGAEKRWDPPVIKGRACGQHILRALQTCPGPCMVCVRRRVPRLIYTSTVNVAFGGKPIKQGDEDSVPYFPLDEVPVFQERWVGPIVLGPTAQRHIDHYSRTKAIADQLTLMANGTPLPAKNNLYEHLQLSMVRRVMDTLALCEVAG
ncbi:hypothetical protein P7K49_023130 [Saguinus oedipus]|uniref:3-beta hydroxysteroid dehydrogenase/isomerase domain-containing protein n=1 Tax=Saguinus oedipus TaxID=9490 RepID=A0ABQ9UKV0_SAGOE|nr:hypothetical protein P7K49_023130 [Saguinus oedipus]